MAHTIFYNGKLKRTRKPCDVFEKVQSFVKKTGVTKLWSYHFEEEKNCIIINFGDEKSESLVFDFVDKSMDGFCKTYFEGDGSEKAVKHGEKQLNAVFSLLYSFRNLFSTFEASDDFNLWNDFVESKRFKLKLRELTKNETERVKEIYDKGFTSHEDLIMYIIAKDLNIPEDGGDFCDYIDYDKNMMFRKDDKFFTETTKILEFWLNKFYVYTGKNDGFGEVSELEFAIFACTMGISELFFEEFTSFYPNRSFGQKHAQVKRFFKEKFMPLWKEESDYYKQALLAYRFMVSVIDYTGFKFDLNLNE